MIFIETINANSIGLGPVVELTVQFHGPVVVFHEHAAIALVAEKQMKGDVGRQGLTENLPDEFAVRSDIMPAWNGRGGFFGAFLGHANAAPGGRQGNEKVDRRAAGMIPVARIAARETSPPMLWAVM